MNIITTNYEELEPKELVTLKCKICSNLFQRTKSLVTHRINNPNMGTLDFCNMKCYRVFSRKKVNVTCLNCNSRFEKLPNQIKKSPNHFCSSSCAATYNNKHKTTGIRRSKAEILIEELISTDFPNMIIKVNDRKVLDSGLEIDIFLPELNIAIELNGPVHYFPIYGETKFSVKNKDIQKQIEIQQKSINLIVIDISKMKYWKKAKIEIEKIYSASIKPVLISATPGN